MRRTQCDVNNQVAMISQNIGKQMGDADNNKKKLEVSSIIPIPTVPPKTSNILPCDMFNYADAQELMTDNNEYQITSLPDQGNSSIETKTQLKLKKLLKTKTVKLIFL